MNIKIRELVFCVVVSITFVPGAAFAFQQAQPDHSDHTAKEKTLAQQLTALQEKVAQLEAMLKQQHAAQSSGTMQRMGDKKGMGMGMKDMKGMGMKDMSKMNDADPSAMQMANADSSSSGMGMGGGMGMKGMGMMKMGGGMGKGMMGRINGMNDNQMAMAASLPGFPGASHLYHIGATSFFLDHSEDVTLTAEQQAQLSRIKEATLLAQNTLDRQIEESEQQLWVLTSADSPDATAVEARVGEIAKLTAEKRIAFIRAVGEAANILAAEQRKILIGYLPPEHTARTPQSHSTTEPAK